MSVKICIYLIIINITAFLLYGIDKKKAVNNKWRIKESTLIGIAIIGGALGAYAGMRFFHHKTRKPLFKYGIPLIFILSVLISFLLLVL